MAFTAYVSTVTLTPTGLPSWTNSWFVNLTAANGTNPLSASTPKWLQQEFNEQIIFNAFNGTRWVANSWQFYYGPSPAKATVTGITSVPSTLTSGTITFTPYVSTVTLTPSGLPSWTTTWFVNLTAANLTNPLGGGHFLNAPYNAVITFKAFNGTKWVANSWQLYYGPSPAQATVTGITTVPTTAAQTIVFTAYVSTVTLTPSGLPSWTTTWFVNLTAANLTHLGPSAASVQAAYNVAITFNAFNGTKWVANSWQQYYGPHLATQTLSGITHVPVTIGSQTIVFTAYVSTVTLTPSGLPSWTVDWFVNLTAANLTHLGPVAASLQAGFGTAITFNAFNGTRWIANSWQFYYGPSPAQATVTGITSVPTTAAQTIVFTAYVSTVTLTPVGLPSWTTTWFVNLTAANLTHLGPATASLQAGYAIVITFNAFNGTRWVADSWQLYYGPSPASRTLTGITSVPSTLTSGTVTFTPYAATVTLTPSGLPSWTADWFVNLTAANSTNPLGGGHFLNAAYNAVIRFNAFNGTTWVTNSWQSYFGPSPATRTVTGITSLPSTQTSGTIVFTAYVSTVTLTPSGLPSWTTTWFVNLTAANLTHLGPAAASLQAGYGTAITFNAFNGTKWVANSWQQYYGPHLATQTLSGIIHLPSTSGSQTIVFTAYLTAITFASASLPSWESWFVNLTAQNATPLASQSSVGGTNIVDHLFNGTYAFTVSSGAKYFGPSPASSSVAVTFGTPQTKTITFTAYLTVITFASSGLPGSESWFVNLTAQNGTGLPSQNSVGGTNIVDHLFNGTYTFIVSSGGKFYKPSPATGPVAVTFGTPQTRTITFTLVTYTVTFTESGLTSGTQWSVTFNSATELSTSTTIVFTEQNGTYSFTVGAVSGYTSNPSSGTIPVSGANVNQGITFTAIIPMYTVTFTETGMPTSAGGGVSFNGGPMMAFTSGGTVTFSGVTNGNYFYTITAGSGYMLVSSLPGSPLTVSGSNVGVTVVFEAVYTVTFTESGLSSGATWEVTLNSATVIQNAPSTIIFTEPNGTYSFTTSASGYTATPSSGSVTVSGHPLTQPISFVPISGVQIYAKTNSTSIATFVLPEIQEFTVGSGAGTVPVTFVTLYLSGSGTVVFSIGSVKWGSNELGNTSVAVTHTGWYNISFAAITLSLGTDYYLNVYETSGSVLWGYTSAPTVKVNTLTEYFYVGSVLTPDTKTPNLYSVGGGSGHPAQMYTVTFTESGLTSGASWSVTLNSATQSASAPSSIVFMETNGTYSFTTSASGYTATPSSGSVTVNGHAVAQAISFTIVVESQIYAQTNATSIFLYALPGIQVFNVGSGVGTVPVTFVTLYLSGSGKVAFSIGSLKFGSNELGNTSVTVTHAGWYNVSFASINLALGTNYYLNVYQTSGSVLWGYTSAPTVKVNTLTEYFYVGLTLTPDTLTPNLYSVGYTPDPHLAPMLAPTMAPHVEQSKLLSPGIGGGSIASLWMLGRSGT